MSTQDFLSFRMPLGSVQLQETTCSRRFQLPNKLCIRPDACGLQKQQWMGSFNMFNRRTGVQETISTGRRTELNFSTLGRLLGGTQYTIR
ncbi:hypothetical protein ElyMa_002688400 [Elysia marginata]|uniref:Uncharacterized protein n=1 Tax=Elysia marginata TaxID=1093978 RepID=A0AAV4HBR1_9GAST|nr:hypothetical protein ElyMa_002688400 [Elysia marginata]